jgi:hypothetical protein
MEQAPHGALVGWTIYKDQPGFPGFYVVRMWEVLKWDLRARVFHHPVGCLCTSLREARMCIPRDLINVRRELEDEPQIVETWI